MRNRMIIVLVAIVAIAALLACGSGGLISQGPTPTPTKTPRPTFTVTLTPTNTPVPTNTPTPTNTATPTPLPTNTPIVYTATPTPLPTDTPVPPTNTPKPTTKPKPRPTSTPTRRPGPTNTPKPQFAWRGAVAGTFANCGLTQVMGLTLDRKGGVAGDIWVHYWTDGWDGDWAKSSWTVNPGYAGTGDEKNWDGTIYNQPRDGTWYVCVTPQDNSWDCISDKMAVRTVSQPCTPDSGGIQVVRIVFQQN